MPTAQGAAPLPICLAERSDPKAKRQRADVPKVEMTCGAEVHAQLLQLHMPPRAGTPRTPLRHPMGSSSRV